MNWGKGISITLVVFVVAVLSTVSYLISLDFYMVSNDHYTEAVEYQETIDRKDRVKELSQPIMVFFEEETETFKIHFPSELAGRQNEGTILLYRPNNSEMDMQFELNLDQSGIQLIETVDIEKGKWIMKLSWTTDGIEFMDEKNILL